MYAVIVKASINGDDKPTLIMCPLDDTAQEYLTENKWKAEVRAVANKKANPKAQYFVVALISEAKEVTQPTYKIEAL